LSVFHSFPTRRSSDLFVEIIRPDGLRGGGDAANQVFLFGLGFGADGEGVEEIEREGKAKGFVLAMAKVALAEDFHAHDAFSDGADRKSTRLNSSHVAI